LQITAYTSATTQSGECHWLAFLEVAVPKINKDEGNLEDKNKSISILN